MRVLTGGHEYLIRTPLKELLPQLDAQTFGRCTAARWCAQQPSTGVTRDEAGKLHLTLKRSQRKKLPVSRLYAPISGHVGHAKAASI